MYIAYFNSCFQESYLSGTQLGSQSYISKVHTQHWNFMLPTHVYFTVSNAGFEATGSLYDRCRIFCRQMKSMCNFLTNDVTYLKMSHFNGMNVSYLLARLCKEDKETRTYHVYLKKGKK
jgi:hypothetical protein